eukprot:TRINITY_DN5367_c0_g2_i1.p4 TRINITY_DN5367_c0_g2~~TRINITY_DN5367_c0_g2_i1.p4  ORF type:complete len:150 (+),score=64.05 TRINITY_DN5367_c0_g2_i1:103-552(+)
MPSPHVAAVAIVGRQHIPLFVSTLGTEDEEEALWLQSVLVSSLDAVEEKLAAILPPTGQHAPEKYLGFLMPAGDYRVHAWFSNTRVKFLLVVKGEARDLEVKQIFKVLHERYSAQVCNPFHEIDSSITSPHFKSDVERAIANSPLRPPP